MHTPHSSTQDFYNQVGDYFSHTRKFLWPEMMPYLNTLKDNDTVLDIGCGNGRLLSGIKTKISYTGVDFSSKLLEHARTLHPKHTFIEADILKDETWQDLPMAHAVFCIAVLHHIPAEDAPYLFEKLSQKVLPGGYLYVSTWNLWQKKYMRYHFSPRSLRQKILNRNFRVVEIPFQKKFFRHCFAYSQADMRTFSAKTDLMLQTTFFSQGNGYLTGRNLVQVYTKSRV